MADRHTPEQRSFNMSRVKGVNTKPELALFAALDLKGIKYKKHYSITGKPDLAFPSQKLAVFVDGEFWHGRNFTIIEKDLPEFWRKKISSNIARDRRQRRELRDQGWQVMRVWAKTVMKSPNRVAYRIQKKIELTN